MTHSTSASKVGRKTVAALAAAACLAVPAAASATSVLFARVGSAYYTADKRAERLAHLYGWG